MCRESRASQTAEKGKFQEGQERGKAFKVRRKELPVGLEYILAILLNIWLPAAWFITNNTKSHAPVEDWRPTKNLCSSACSGICPSACGSWARQAWKWPSSRGNAEPVALDPTFETCSKRNTSERQETCFTKWWCRSGHLLLAVVTVPEAREFHCWSYMGILVLTIQCF